MFTTNAIFGMPLHGSSSHLSEAKSQLRTHSLVLTSAAVPRFDTIDLLRGLSILGVVLLHASLFLSFSDYRVGTSLPNWLTYLIFNEGGNGVSAFFAISGFLITFVSIRRFGSLSRLSPVDFYRIRVARIVPPLAALLLVLSMLHFSGLPIFHIDPSRGTLARALFAAATFQTNWYEAVHGWLPANWTVLWSLSVEEMFYLFFPLLCLGLMRPRWSRPLFVTVLLAFVAFGPIARSPWYTKNDIWAYQSYLGNMDNVALGCLFGLLADRLSRARRIVESIWPVLFQVTGALLVFFIVEWTWPKIILGWHIKRALGVTGLDVTVLGVGTCLILLGSVLKESQGRLWSAPIRWLGRYSYEVYLTHEFVVIGVLTLFLHFHRGPVAAWIILTVLISGGLGHLMSRLLSEPLNRRLRGALTPAQLKVEP